jgi:hypothetical protein
LRRAAEAAAAAAAAAAAPMLDAVELRIAVDSQHVLSVFYADKCVS